MKKRKAASEAVLFLLILLLGAVFLISATESAESVRYSLAFTVSSVIPSLFPFMVMAKLISGSQITEKLTRVLYRPAERAFGLGADSLAAVILGFISGFPIGAMTVSESYRKGIISKKEAERTLALAHNTGPSFPIGFVGAVLWNSKTFGVFLYVSQLLSWIIICRLYRGSKLVEKAYSDAVNGNCKGGFARLFTDAISSSALSCVSIAGFTAFMKVCSEAFVFALPKMPFSAIAAVTSFFEFSDGCVKASSVGGIFGCAITGFSIGFGGLSAFLQGAAPALGEGLSIRPLILIKLTEGMLCAALASLYGYIIEPKSCTKFAAVMFTGDLGYGGAILLALTGILSLIVKICSKDFKTS